MVKRYNGGVIVANQISTTNLSASGFFGLTHAANAVAKDQWPASIGVYIFTISPAYSGKTTWDIAVDGPLNISASGTYTITPTNSFLANVRMWGGGGGSGSQGGSGGGGGSSVGTVRFSVGVSHILVIGQGGRAGAGGTTTTGGGGSGDVNRGGGGGYSGIFRTSLSQANAVLMSGGGGGAGGGTGSSGAGAGGGSSGQNGNNGINIQPGGGTQIAGGAVAGAGSAGSALTGANGLSGGGGGYFGGASGGDQSAYAPGAGGGSGYINATYVTSAITYTGNLTAPGNSSDTQRGTSGDARSGSSGTGNDGRIYMNLSR